MDELDRILAADDPLVPSAGFTARVMAAVDAQASEPPLPFPWARFLLGVGACLACGASWAWALDRVEATAVLEALEMLPGLGEALLAAVVSVSVWEVIRHRARADS